VHTYIHRIWSSRCQMGKLYKPEVLMRQAESELRLHPSASHTYSAWLRLRHTYIHRIQFSRCQMGKLYKPEVRMCWAESDLRLHPSASHTYSAWLRRMGTADPPARLSGRKSCGSGSGSKRKFGDAILVADPKRADTRMTLTSSWREVGAAHAMIYNLSTTLQCNCCSKRHVDASSRTSE